MSTKLFQVNAEKLLSTILPQNLNTASLKQRVHAVVKHHFCTLNYLDLMWKNECETQQKHLTQDISSVYYQFLHY